MKAVLKSSTGSIRGDILDTLKEAQRRHWMHQRDYNASYIAYRVGCSPGTAMRHLRKLKEEDLVQQIANGAWALVTDDDRKLRADRWKQELCSERLAEKLSGLSGVQADSLSRLSDRDLRKLTKAITKGTK